MAEIRVRQLSRTGMVSETMAKFARSLGRALIGTEYSVLSTQYNQTYQSRAHFLLKRQYTDYG